ncbi:unnamed protein product, partial [Rotaria sp. Silwood1]
GGTITISNETLCASTIRLDDVEWPAKSSILMLKIDVEGFELNTLRSTEKLFREKRIHHLIFEYTACVKQLFVLDRTVNTVYGPLTYDYTKSIS